MGYFDREGVDELRRTLTRISETEAPTHLDALSSETLSVPATGPLNFERKLRTSLAHAGCVHGRRTHSDAPPTCRVPRAGHPLPLEHPCRALPARVRTRAVPEYAGLRNFQRANASRECGCRRCLHTLQRPNRHFSHQHGQFPNHQR
jgi:hypothetical protein